MTGDAIWALAVLAVPFLLGVAVGIEFRKRWPVIKQVIVTQPDPHGELGQRVWQDIEAIQDRMRFTGGADAVRSTRTSEFAVKDGSHFWVIVANRDITA